MSTLEETNDQIAEAEGPFWDLVREGKYDSHEARELAAKLRDLRAERRVLLGEPVLSPAR